MLFKLVHEGGKHEFRAFEKRSASELRLVEKDLENWLAENSKLLFGSEEVLVIAQSVSGQRMADILALDALGQLIIVEIKRDWSDRSTVGQLLEYAAEKSRSKYDILEKLHSDYLKRTGGKDSNTNLLTRFRELTDDNSVKKTDIPNGHRICIVAPASDTGLQKIIEWLNEYRVPISFLPFALYADADSDSQEILLEIEQLPQVQQMKENGPETWRGNWLFNTNESWFPGAYKEIFQQGVIAICGYQNGPYNLEGSESGQRVFAYVNKKGILAVGHITDGKVFPGASIFDGNKEFHVSVEWEIVLAEDKGISNREVREKFDHGLPVRNVFCGLYRPEISDWIVRELEHRSKKE